MNTFAWEGHATYCSAVALRLSITNKCQVHLGSTVLAYSTGERGCRYPVCHIMCENVEQLLRQRCPHISEHFLPDLLTKFQRHDIDASMLLAGELNDADLQAIGALCMLCSFSASS